MRRAIARDEPGVREHESEQRAAAREEPGVREQEQSVNTVRRAIAREEPGVIERESLQRAAARDEPGVLERESLQPAAAREEPGVLERESLQRAAAREEPGVLVGGPGDPLPPFFSLKIWRENQFKNFENSGGDLVRPRIKNLASPIFDSPPPQRQSHSLPKSSRPWEDIRPLAQWIGELS